MVVATREMPCCAANARALSTLRPHTIASSWSAWRNASIRRRPARSPYPQSPHLTPRRPPELGSPRRAAHHPHVAEPSIHSLGLRLAVGPGVEGHVAHAVPWKPGMRANADRAVALEQVGYEEVFEQRDDE